MTNKKELKHDPVRENIFQGIELVKKNQKKITQAVVGIAVVVTGYWIYNNSLQTNENEAAVIFGKAQNMYIDTQLDLAKIEFQNATDDYNGTTGSNLAKFYLATEHIKNGESEKALILFEELASQIEDDILLSSVLNTIGNLHMDQENYDDAIDRYLDASKSVELGPFKHQYQLNAARGYKLNNQIKLAHDIVSDILDTENLKYNIKNDSEELLGELEYLMNQ